MFTPRLMQEQGSGKWHCIWRATASGQVMAHASSDDLLTWGAQSYFEPGGEKPYLPVHTCRTGQLEATVEGKVCQGWAQRVPYSLIENLVRYANHKRLRQSLHDEQTAQDGTRFTGLKPLTATITVNTTQAKAISNHLIGIFFEDINYAADGGLYAELVQNRDFEYSPRDGSREKWDSGYAWTVREGEHTAAPAIGHGTAPASQQSPLCHSASQYAGYQPGEQRLRRHSPETGHPLRLQLSGTRCSGQPGRQSHRQPAHA